MCRSLEMVAQADTLIIIGCGLRTEDMFLYVLPTAFSDGKTLPERKIVVLDSKAGELVCNIKTYLTVDDAFCMVPIPEKLQPNSVEQLLEAIQK
jgi:hypothetical protein